MCSTLKVMILESSTLEHGDLIQKQRGLKHENHSLLCIATTCFLISQPKVKNKNKSSLQKRM
jgi:hypothetical protein